MLLAMAVTMTVPMVGWMRYRGQGRQACAEMSAATAMLLRPAEYTGAAHGHRQLEVAA